MSTLHVQKFGSGLPIYFLHGHALNSESMKTFYEAHFALYPQFQRIYLDLPGMGSSPLAATHKNTDSILAELFTFIQEDAQGQPFLLSGHSYGGYLCLGLAHLLEEQVAGLFLTCPVVKARHNERQVARHQQIRLAPIAADVQNTYFSDYLSMNVQIKPSSWQGYQQAIIPGLEQGIAPFWDELTDEDYALSFESSLTEKLISTTGTILVGAYDQVVGYRDHQTLFANTPEITLQLLEKSGHNLPLDEPERFGQAFTSFLTAHAPQEKKTS